MILLHVVCMSFDLGPLVSLLVCEVRDLGPSLVQLKHHALFDCVVCWFVRCLASMSGCMGESLPLYAKVSCQFVLAVCARIVVHLCGLFVYFSLCACVRA